MQCDIVSATEMIYSSDVSMLVVTGIAGELGITPRHAPLITKLKAGPVRVIDHQGEENVFFAGGGILEVMPHMVTLLADTVIRADDIDEAAAAQAKAEAERMLMDRSGGMEVAEAQVKLKEAVEQLRALEQMRRRMKSRR